jgi:hypothetical protein
MKQVQRSKNQMGKFLTREEIKASMKVLNEKFLNLKDKSENEKKDIYKKHFLNLNLFQIDKIYRENSSIHAGAYIVDTIEKSQGLSVAAESFEFWERFMIQNACNEELALLIECSVPLFLIKRERKKIRA